MPVRRLRRASHGARIGLLRRHLRTGVREENSLLRLALLIVVGEAATSQSRAAEQR